MLCLLWLISTTAHGQSFNSGNLRYYITDNTNNTVRVTKPAGASKYTGNVTIPATVTYSGVTYSVTAIEAQAFHSCAGLSSITIGSNVTEIGSQAFWGCTLLTSITIGPNVTEIGSEAFRGCTKLTSMTIPDNVTKIGGQAFLGCTKLTSVTIGKGVTTIGSDAFYDCSELNEIICYAESAPTCVGSPGVSSNCTLYVPANGTGYDVAPWSNFTNIQKVAFYNDDDPIKYSFDNNAKTATITDGKSCSGAVVIPEKVMKDGVVYTVTAIGKDAFNGSRITSINIPKSITSIGSDAFQNCSMLDKVIVSDLAAWFNVSFDNMYSPPMYYATHLYSDENTEITELVIPEGVTKIPNYALYRCTNLTSVTFPNSLVSFSSFAFLGCSKLTSLTIPNGVESIGNSTFQDCSGLVTVTIGSGVKTIYPYAFNHCSNIKEIVSLATTAPGCMTDAFNQVPTSCILYVPQGSTGYDKEPWSNFTLKEMVGEEDPVCVDGIWYNRDKANKTATVAAVPEGGTAYSGNIAIPETISVFENASLEKVKYTVTAIGDQAFHECVGLTGVTIGSGVETIGAGAFFECKSIKTIVCNAMTPPTFTVTTTSDEEKASFDADVFRDCVVYVPLTSLSAYQEHEAWKTFHIIIGFVAIDETNFPDQKFRDYLLTKIDTDNDGLLTKELETTEINVSNEGIESLKGIEYFTALNSLNCSNNQIKGEDMDALIESLPETTDGILNVYNANSQSEGNVITKTQVAAAKAKGWTPQYLNGSTWSPYDGSTPKSITVTIGEEGLATYCPEYGVDFSSATKIAAYTASVNGNTVMLTKVNKVAAGEGVLLRSLDYTDGNSTVTKVTEELTVDDDITTNADNAFVGTTTETTLIEENGVTNFVLSNVDGVVGFFKARNNMTLAAGKAYLPVEDYSPTSGIRLVFSDTTGIIEIAPEQPTDSDAIYTIGGVRVKNPSKGLYIKNGKKILY